MKEEKKYDGNNKDIEKVLKKFEKALISGKGEYKALQECLSCNIDTNRIFDIIKYKCEVDMITEALKNYTWHDICKMYNLSEKFIEDNIPVLSWADICTYQTLSEDFIRKYKDNVDWLMIFLKNRYSKEFLYEFQDEIRNSVENKLYELAKEDK